MRKHLTMNWSVRHDPARRPHLVAIWAAVQPRTRQGEAGDSANVSAGNLRVLPTRRFEAPDPIDLAAYAFLDAEDSLAG